MSGGVVCCVAKMLGLFSFAGNTKGASLLYSVILWLCFSSSGAYMVIYYYKQNQNVSSKNNMLMKMVFIEVLSKFVVATIGMSILATRSRRAFFDLIDKFDMFDELTLGERCSSNSGAQKFYMLHVTLIFVHDFSWNLASADVPFYILVTWHMYCVFTMTIFVQYVIYTRMVGQRFELANRIFKSSATENFSSGTKYMYPKELVDLYIQLRGLTEEVKTYYVYHAILIIVESVIILITSVTALTANYINGMESQYSHLIGHSMMRLLFLFYVVRETHNTKLEANNTTLIGHEALNTALDITTTKFLEVIVLNCWNHPIVFDVHDFFDLDYKLLQSIIASVVTYVVVLVQIQLAIIDM